MKYVLGFVTMVVLACNSDTTVQSKNSEEVLNDSSKGYPNQVIALGAERLYDEAKWVMYCIYSDHKCDFRGNGNIARSAPFSSLDLRFEKALKFGDTLEIYFYFYGDSLKCDPTNVVDVTLATGVGYRIPVDSILYFTSNTTLRQFWTNDPLSRYKNPLQPDVVNYIRHNKEKLHPWFYEEAVKRNVLQ